MSTTPVNLSGGGGGPPSTFEADGGDTIYERALVLDMDDDGSTTWSDDGDVGHTVTPVNGPSQLAAAALDGSAAGGRLVRASNQYLSIPDHASLRPNSAAYGLAMLIKPTAVNVTQCLAIKGVNSAANWGIYIKGNGTNGSLSLYKNSAVELIGTEAQAVVTAGVVQEVLFLQIPTYGSVILGYLFVDRILRGAGIIPASARLTDAGDLNIGSDAGVIGGTSAFGGDIDKVRIWKGRLTAGVAVYDGIGYPAGGTPGVYA